MSDDGGKLQDAVNAKTEPIFMRTKSEIWEYYLDKNSGDKRKAASEAGRALYDAFPEKYSSYKNARRNFEERGGQMVGAKAGDTAKWHAMGEKLPEIGRKPIGNELKITVEGSQYEKRGERTREFTVTFKGPDAQAFVNDPSYWAFFYQYGYPLDIVQRFDGGDSSALYVTAVY